MGIGPLAGRGVVPIGDTLVDVSPASKGHPDGNRLPTINGPPPAAPLSPPSWGCSKQRPRQTLRSIKTSPPATHSSRKVNETYMFCKLTPPECNRHRTTGRRPIHGIMKILTNQDVPTVDGKYSAKSPDTATPPLPQISMLNLWMCRDHVMRCAVDV
jgi:hypothetical protein